MFKIRIFITIILLAIYLHLICVKSKKITTIFFTSCNLTSVLQSFTINCTIDNPQHTSIYYTIGEEYESASMTYNVMGSSGNTNRYFTILNNTNPNICKVLETRLPATFNFIQKFLHNKEKISVPRKCPLQMGTYYLKQLAINSQIMPLPVLDNIKFVMNFAFTVTVNKTVVPSSVGRIAGYVKAVNKP